MASNINSHGVPVDQEGEPLEYGVIGGNIAPFAVSGEVFRELFGGSAQFEDSHLEPHPLDGFTGHSSSSGGIPIAEHVEIEDITNVVSDEEPLSPQAAREVCKNNTSSTVHAVLRTSKFEREELYRAREKLGNVLAFLKKKGFSEKQILEEMSMDGWGQKPQDRDEFGLPVELEQKEIGSPPVGCDPFVDKMKNKLESGDAPVVFDVKTHRESSSKGLNSDNKVSLKPHVSQVVDGDATHEENKVNSKTWSSVVKNRGNFDSISFDYCPIPNGGSVVTPPSDVLKKGLEKFKLCLVGVFSKGTLPLSKVVDITRKSWDSKGLCSVSQKDSHTFHFKFSSESDMNAVLARGTWYFERKPLILRGWGADLVSEKDSTMPLWVKFENLPDYYWTREGLSCVASAIGPPICADKTTSQLNPVQFAKMCVRYTVGDPLPEKIKVAALDMKTMDLSPSETIDIAVSYPQRPRVCSGCKQLGHLIGACPIVKRVWVQKPSQEKQSESSVEPNISKGVSVTATVSNQSTEVNTGQKPIPVEPVTKPPVVVGSDVAKTDVEDGAWTTVKGKKSSPPKQNPSSSVLNPGQTPIYTALAKSMSKGQLKRARNAAGRGSPKKK